MNTYELNKVFGAILFAGLTAMTAWLISLAAFGKLEHGHHERVIHYVVAGLEQDDAMHDEAAVEEPEMPAISLAELLADADPAKGQKVFKKCAACHTVDDGGKNKVGPNLWNVVNAEVGKRGGFAYSKAMVEKGGTWTYENLNAFLAKPKAFVPKTKMAFAGLKKANDRAAVIVYLRTLSDSPAPLP